jgi:hypothetical protein
MQEDAKEFSLTRSQQIFQLVFSLIFSVAIISVSLFLMLMNGSGIHFFAGVLSFPLFFWLSFFVLLPAAFRAFRSGVYRVSSTSLEWIRPNGEVLSGKWDDLKKIEDLLTKYTFLDETIIVVYAEGTLAKDLYKAAREISNDHPKLKSLRGEMINEQEQRAELGQRRYFICCIIGSAILYAIMFTAFFIVKAKM